MLSKCDRNFIFIDGNKQKIYLKLLEYNYIEPLTFAYLYEKHVGK